MERNRKETLQNIDKHIIEDRFLQVDQDYLEFEIKMSSAEDLTRISDCLHAIETFNDSKVTLPLYLENPHNSLLLYITGLTNVFDFQ